MRTISQVLHDGTTHKGQEKLLALSQQRGWIAPSCEGKSVLKGSGLTHRISWERLEEHIRTYRSRNIRMLRSAVIGAENAEKFKRLPSSSAVEVAVVGIQDALLRDITDYDPANGFDLDILIKVRDLVTQDAIVSVEVFPRKEKGVHSTAVTSDLRFAAPFLAPQTEMGGLILASLLFSEKQNERELTDLLNEWDSRSGLWYIERTEVCINTFLSYCMNSMLAGNGFPPANGHTSVSSDETGQPLEANFAVGVRYR